MLQLEKDNILSKTLMCRLFEMGAVKHQKYIKQPIYLSVGTEHIPATITEAIDSIPGLTYKHVALFAQHRCHSYYLCFNGNIEDLACELCGLKGCNKGMGGSASISNTDTALMFGHSGLLGDQVPIATGYAHTSNKHTICILGDAAVEEDYALASFGYAITKKAPILYLVEDNDLSILTKKEVRRSWDVVNVAQGFGIKAKHIEINDIDRLFDEIKHFLCNPQPTLLNIKCERHLWHAGFGQDSPPIHDIFSVYDYKQINGACYINSIIDNAWERAKKLYVSKYY